MCKPKVRKLITQIRLEVKHLIQTTVPGWSKCAEDLQKWLDEDWPLSSELKLQINDVIDSLLHGNNLTFFKTLWDFKSSGFGGSMHCEVILASLLNHSKRGTIDGIYEDIWTQLKVSYSTMLSSSDPIFLS